MPENVSQRPTQLALVICSGRFGFPLLNAPQIKKTSYWGYICPLKNTPNLQKSAFGIKKKKKKHPKSRKRGYLGYIRPLKTTPKLQKITFGIQSERQAKKNRDIRGIIPVFSTVTPFCGSLLWKNRPAKLTDPGAHLHRGLKN